MREYYLFEKVALEKGSLPNNKENKTTPQANISILWQLYYDL